MATAHRIVGPGDVPADGVADTGQSSNRIVAEGHGRIRIRRTGSPVQGVVGKRRLLALPIGERRKIAIQIILIALGSIQRIGACFQSIHLIVGIDRRLILRIRDG